MRQEFNAKHMRLVGGRIVRTIRRVTKAWAWWMTAALAGGLLGCAEPGPRSSRTLRPVADASPPPTPAAEPVVVAPSAPLLPEPTPPMTSSLPAMVKSGPAWPSNWVNAWIPLESWGQFNGTERPRQLSGGAEPMYQLATSNGVLTLRMGNQVLRFGGTDFWLGFAPKSIKGLPYIHAVDARRTLQPLLAPPFQSPRTNRTIVIDAGHGGKDSGTRSCVNGEPEKQYALDWARRLERLLMTQGWNVVMTRTNDVYLSLAERVAIAERVRADMFVSLHFNSGPGNEGLSGIETYCLPATGMPSTLRRGFADDPSEVLPNNAFDDGNFQLATAMHRSVLSATGAADRGVCRARFLGVLRGQNRPAVLIEGGYLSNTAEARKIGTSTHRQALAEGVAKALE